MKQFLKLCSKFYLSTVIIAIVGMIAVLSHSNGFEGTAFFLGIIYANGLNELFKDYFEKKKKLKEK